MNYKRLTVIFFGIYLIAGLFICKDYGLNWDDEHDRDYGLVNWNYVFKNDKTLLTHFDRYHGPALEMVLVGVEKIFHVHDEHDIFLAHHFADFLLFYFSVIAFFLLARQLLGADKWGLLACLMLVLSPRIFGDSFFNSKDIGFLCGCIFSLYTLYRLSVNPNFFNLVIHTLVCGFTIDIRILGLLFVPFAIILLVKNIITEPASRKRYFILLPLYLVLQSGFIILFWPILWKNPWNNICEAVHVMSQYPWDYGILYLGKELSTKNMPWHYLPLWILISTPLLFSILYLIGTTFILRNFILGPVRFLKQQIIWAGIWLFAIAPILAVIIFKSVVYDAWRHVFFIYPFFILVATYGLKNCYERLGRVFQRVTTIFMTAYLAMLLCVVVYLHPFEDIYFNFPALVYFKPVSEEFDMDYWGLSYKQGLEFILADNPDKDIINIYSTANSGPNFANREFLPPAARARINFVLDTAGADYFMTGRRWKGEYQPSRDKLAFQAKRFGNPVVIVYKFKSAKGN